MLLFSTMLDISDQMTVDDFIGLVIEWNRSAGSFHPENAVPDIVWEGEHNIRYGNEKLWMEIQEYRNGNIVAVRYENQGEDGIIWDTDYIMNFNTRKLSIRLERSYTEEAFVSDESFSSPYFITMLIDRGWVLDDGDLPVSHSPIYLTNENARILSDVVNVVREYSLPVVYVSRTEFDRDPVNVRDLAWNLKGTAHVLVETSRLMDDSLMILCGGQIERGGEVGVYFPNQTRAPRRYSYRAGEGPDPKLHKIVTRTVLSWYNAQKTDPLSTWFGVNNALLQDRLLFQREQRMQSETQVRQALYEKHLADLQHSREIADIERKAREAAQAEADSYMDEISAEMDGYLEQIRSLMNQVARLEAENAGLRSRLSPNGTQPVLYMGQKEQDFYPGEVKDLVLSTLERSMKQMLNAGTRRCDVIKDVIEGNGFEDISTEKAEEASGLLTGYTKLTPRICQELERLGFVLTDEGKHMKGRYYGDNRYTITYAKTPSDARTGKNTASEIRKTVF